jgi:hypothetical protein
LPEKSSPALRPTTPMPLEVNLAAIACDCQAPGADLF